MARLAEQLKMIEVTPDQKWKNETRSFLLSEIANYKQKHLIGEKKTSRAGLFSGWQAVSFAWRPVGVAAVVMLFFLSGSGLLTVASRDAVPGDKLFALRRAWEKVNEYMVIDAAHKTELASAVLDKRVNDLQRVLDQESQLVSAGEKTEPVDNINIMVAVNEVKKQVEEVNDKFAAMQDKEKESGEKLAATALALNDKIINYKEELKAVRDKVNNTEADQELGKVLEKVETINTEVLAVLVEKHGKGELPAEENKLASRLEDHLNEVKNKADQVAGAVGGSEDKTGSELAVKLDEAKETIKKASEALDKNEYSLVLTLTKDSDKILEMIYGSIYEVKNDGDVKGEATSTPEILTPKTDNGSSTSTTIENSTSTENNSSQKEEAVAEEPEIEESVEFQVDIVK